MEQSAWVSNRYIAFLVSLVIHVLLVLFLFLFVLRTPLPPFTGGQGVVLNLGFVDEGSGEVQTLNEANNSISTNENRPNPEPEVKTTTPNEPQDTKENTSDKNSLLTSNEESEVWAEPKKEVKKDAWDNPKEKPNPNTIPEEKKEKEPVKTINKRALFGQEGQATDGGNNNGDKANALGDQGNPQGDINAKALHGNLGAGGEGTGGAGGGATLDMAGWKWAKIPRVQDDDENERGRIVFQVTIDDEGHIIDVKTIEKTVGASTERLYRQEVEKLTFVKTDGKAPAPQSTGRITFIIKAR